MKDRQPKPFGAMPEVGLVRKATLLQVLGISGPTLWRWIQSGRFPRADYRLGPRLPVWPAEEVRRWLADNGFAGEQV
ncbi:hypothetical protein CWO89_24375 [Bradyrhizobium sp. Leo170]|nr:hypothetical protein CWO89_24375 [Bradyrhizobium sp. Leo170]